MKNILYILLTSMLIFSSCSKQKNSFIGKVYTYQNGNEKQTVGFSDDKIYFKWDDSLGIDAFETDYTAKAENDTLMTITLVKKPEYFENNNWQIVLKEQGFYTMSSKKFYKQITESSNKK